MSSSTSGSDNSDKRQGANGRSPKRRRWLRFTALGFALVAALVAGATYLFQFGAPWSTSENDINHVYESEGEKLRYQVHLPPQYDEGEPLPVMMAIHGCGMTGYGWNSMRESTQFNALADEEGFIVVYPSQAIFENMLNCWNSDSPQHQQRAQFQTRGEPELLAGIAREVVEIYNADASQVHVAGASSGAGTAVILAATYPEVFASASSIAGGEYALNQVDPDDPDSVPVSFTARQAWAQMGERSRDVPLMIIQGEEDDVVPVIVAERLQDQWLDVLDLVDDGQLNGSRDIEPVTEQVMSEPGVYDYQRTTWGTDDGVTLVDYVLVSQMGHVWSGPAGEGWFTDQSGPDASRMVWDFAREHALGSE